MLVERFFTEQQIDKVIPRLSQEFYNEPKYLAEIVDTWNIIMNTADPQSADYANPNHIPPMASAPPNSLMGLEKVNTATILADIEPDLLLIDPKKLFVRHKKVLSLGIVQNKGQEWTLLYNAPRGFFLQDWYDLMKKVFYIEHNIIDFLYDKKEQKTMEVHPLLKSAASVEIDFDHIRTRYLFALRCGYKSLSHMYEVQMALDRPTLRDLVLVDNKSFMSKFAPYCSLEEYSTFSDLIKNTEVDEDDKEIFEKFAELECLKSV